MAAIDHRQIETLLEDIASIKSVINKNKPLIHQFLMPRHFRFFSLIAGISVFVPIISTGTGLTYNFIGSITEIRQWLVSGYWFLITGMAILLVNPIPATLALAVTMGCGLLLFAAVPSREV